MWFQFASFCFAFPSQSVFMSVNGSLFLDSGESPLADGLFPTLTSKTFFFADGLSSLSSPLMMGSVHPAGVMLYGLQKERRPSSGCFLFFLLVYYMFPSGFDPLKSIPSFDSLLEF